MIYLNFSKINYERTWPDGQLAVLKNMPSEFGSAITALVVPAEHIARDDDSIMKTFKNEWSEFTARMSLDDEPFNREAMLRSVSRSMISRDLHYMGGVGEDIVNGRPGRRFEDNYTSIFRDYVLRDSGIKSPAYRNIVSDMRDVQDPHDVSPRLGPLAADWELQHRRHVDERFRTDECYFAGALALAALTDRHDTGHRT